MLPDSAAFQDADLLPCVLHVWDQGRGKRPSLKPFWVSSLLTVEVQYGTQWCTAVHRFGFNEMINPKLTG